MPTVTKRQNCDPNPGLRDSSARALNGAGEAIVGSFYIDFTADPLVFTGSEGYVKKDSAKNGIESVRKNASDSPVVEAEA